MGNALYWGGMTAVACFLLLWGLLSVTQGFWELAVLVGIALLAGIQIACAIVICAKRNHPSGKKR